jgi:acetolactate synthase-1/2/3 large subunit
MTNSEISISGADVLVQNLKELGVDTIFAITGAGNLAIIDAIARDGSFTLIYSHHEQAAVMEAQGYSRITNRLSVALVTTGGGSSNVVTGMLSAYLDSIPVLLISGNESSFHCINPHSLRAYGVQGFDSCAVLAPVSKSSRRIKRVEEVSLVIQEAANLAMNQRRGPTHIDFPMDLQRKIVDPSSLMPPTDTEEVNPKLNVDSVAQLIRDIKSAKNPLFYFGNGIRNPDAIELSKKLISQTGIPYLTSWSAIDIFPEVDDLNVGRIGIYGDRHANILLQKSDLIVAIGTRLAIPQIGYDKQDFGRKAKKWVVEIDPTECSKFEGLDWEVLNADGLDLLLALNEADYSGLNNTGWASECKTTKARLPRRDQLGPDPTEPQTQLHSGDVIDFLNLNLASNAMISTDVGAALLTGHAMYEQSGTRRFFTSQGLGEMGFGLPGAIGAYFADSSRQIVCLNTDGALMFNMQELQVIKEHKIPLKLFVFNNFGYSMIRISQENLFDGRLSGSTVDSGISFPSFKDIAVAFSFGYTSISTKDNLRESLAPLGSKSAELIEIIMDPEQKYFPRLATNKLQDGTLVSPPLEDMDPKIDIVLLEELLGYKAHENSYKARGL